MSYSLLPLEIKNEVISYINPSKITCREVSVCGRIIIVLMNKESKNICEKKLANLKKIYELINKYYKYDSYDYPSGGTQLYDALMTGCSLSLAKHSIEQYTPEVEEDIKTIVKLVPKSMNYQGGYLRCKYSISPIAAACYNENIPISIIEFLLKSGANPNTTINAHGRIVSLISDLGFNISDDRLKNIYNLFQQYGFKDESLHWRAKSI